MKGIGVSPGIAIGKAYVLGEYIYDFSNEDSFDAQEGVEKFKLALERSREEIRALRVRAEKTIGEEYARIFDAHMEIVQDPQMVKEIESSIRSENQPLLAVKLITEKYINMFQEMENEYFKDRALDIEDVQRRLYRNIMGYKEVDLSNLPKDTILVSKDLTPSETAVMDKENVVGFLTEVGGTTSHTAIIARNLGIPAVMGIEDLTEKLDDSTLLVIDGYKGDVILPDDKEIELYRRKNKVLEKMKDQLEQTKHNKSRTTDGREIDVFSNIGNPEEAILAIGQGAEGIGLFRTEFLYMESKEFPTEDIQYLAYKQALDNMEGRPVIFRTLDIGGDKDIPYFNLPSEDNPFLGWRAIRICFDRKDIFLTQLRALLRASAHGKVWIMFPMISSIEDIEQAMETLEEAKGQLRKEDINYYENVKIGIMVEIPSIAVIADKVSKYVDFMSIGTNDLTQYTLACDRINVKVSKYYESFQPGVLHLIDKVIGSGAVNDVIVGMCGELAGNPLAIPLLVGMGLTEFSMSPKAIPKAKKIIGSLSFESARQVRRSVLGMDRASEIKSYLESVLVDMGLDYLLEL